VARKVVRVVKRAGGRVGAAEPERGGVRADSAEPPGGAARQVKCAEAAHRDAADRNAMFVGVRPRDRGRNRLAKHRRPPPPIAAVVPVAVVAAVDEQDGGRPPTKVVERVEEGLPEVRVGRRAAAVQEHEQLTAASPTGRDDEDLVKIA
jgi:hypothetical protein